MILEVASYMPFTTLTKVRKASKVFMTAFLARFVCIGKEEVEAEDGHKYHRSFLAVKNTRDLFDCCRYPGSTSVTNMFIGAVDTGDGHIIPFSVPFYDMLLWDEKTTDKRDYLANTPTIAHGQEVRMILKGHVVSGRAIVPSADVIVCRRSWW